MPLALAIVLFVVGLDLEMVLRVLSPQDMVPPRYIRSLKTINMLSAQRSVGPV